jgi:NAD(P)H-hydrate epimerase
MPSFTRAHCREVDRRAVEDYGMSGLVLMENAGRGTADLLCRFLDLSSASENTPIKKTKPRVLICCGAGNNGGDGFVIARHLDLRGCEVQVLVWAHADKLPEDAAVNFQILERSGVPLRCLTDCGDEQVLSDWFDNSSWIVDCLLGTGAKGEPRPPLGAVIDRINASAARCLAVDIPSGLDCDSGMAAKHTIRADITATFVGPKQGFLSPSANDYLGKVHVVDIGAPRKLIEDIATD